MRVYLVRHGDAMADAVDAARPLTPRGRDEIGRVARLAAALGFEVAEIRHSGLLRARKTAEILDTQLAAPRGIREAPGLRPGDDPWILAGECEGPGEPVMLVGHLPHLGRLAGALLVGDPAREVVRFDTGTIAGLVKGPSGWAVASVIGPPPAAAGPGSGREESG